MDSETGTHETIRHVDIFPAITIEDNIRGLQEEQEGPQTDLAKFWALQSETAPKSAIKTEITVPEMPVNHIMPENILAFYGPLPSQ
ncbi:hypothetical protein N7463_010315 [Penicillium fimorum]|uniref:Uncharacterized protein n=1 Tax=Penicillium fimorum TaxID=1882269 RepID=A0A9X0C148_9EURO|nr:hypothetical protein N7463_010315 [Penicillium fimorum]